MVAVRFLFFLMSLSGSGFLLATESPSALDSDLPMSPASYCSEEEESDDEKKLPRKSKFRSSMAILQEAKLREEIQSQKQQDLESAITRGSLEDLVAAVESGAEINKRCYDKKRTAVHLAVKHGDFSMVSYLVQKQQERKEAEYNKRMEPFLEEEEESLTVEEGEADEIAEIIYAFKFHMLPELGDGDKTGRNLKVPSTFDIQYMYVNQENNYLHKISTCYLSSMDVSYGGSKYTTYDGNADGAPPVETSMKLTFKEIELITRERVEEGF